MPSSTQLVDDAVTEILLRLPPKSVLRFRSVSKHWRRITTCPTFLAAYSRRRPLELLAYPDGYKLGHVARNVLAAVDPLNSGAGGDTVCRCFLRFDSPLHLVDCRDGLLLFARRQRSFLICNPATRQWASLPSLTPEPCTCVVASGLYFHRPSGEHRLLCIGTLPPHGFKYHPPSGRYRRVPPHGEAVPPAADYVHASHYILSTGAAKPRRLGAVAAGSKNGVPSACLALGGTLHWSHHPESGDSGTMVAFDTVSETFRLIVPPPLIGFGGLSHHLRLFDMDGTLAVSAVRAGSPCMDVWALEDDDGGGGDRWACRLRIDDLPPARRFEWHASYEAVAVVEGGVLVVVGSGWVLLYDMKEKRTVSMADRHSGGDIRNLSQCLYRASLVSLPEPDAQPCPCASPGGKPLLQYCSADDHLYMLSKGSKCDAWIVPNQI